MSKIINDDIDTTLTIDGQPWHVKEAIVELSRNDTPNYVDLLIIPDIQETVNTLPDPIDQLVGATFELSVDNKLISQRDATEDSLLFSGNLANISPTGKEYYEAIAYGPGQQLFSPSENAGGSIYNTTITVGLPEYGYDEELLDGLAVRYETNTIKASEFVQRAVDKVGLTEYEINLTESGTTITGENGSYQGGIDRDIWFSEDTITIKEGFNKIKNWCEAEWWFDKQGVFHFGLPDPTRHELRYIVDSDAGKTTPPYQSVRVIGSGAASAEGFERTHMNIEDKIVVEAEMAIDNEGNPVANFGQVKEPVFEYKNLEISTDAQARSTAKSIIEDLSEQQSDGKITVVGFPEVVPMDGVVLPNTDKQPMGGNGYNVYKVTHYLNDSDGFLTDIQVSGVTGVTKTKVSSSQAATSYDLRAYEDAGVTGGAVR